MSPDDACRSRVNLLLSLLVLVNGVLIGAGMLCYGEEFRFWDYPVSDLGSTVTPNGQGNAASMALFCLDMLASASIMTAAGWAFRRAGRGRVMKVKGSLCFAAAAGFCVTAFPHDISNTVHTLGAGLMVCSFWLITVILLFEAKPRVSGSRFWLVQLLLQGTVLPYAAAFAVDAQAKQVAQKLAVVGLLAALQISSSMVLKPRQERHRKVAAAVDG